MENGISNVLNGKSDNEHVQENGGITRTNGADISNFERGENPPTNLEDRTIDHENDASESLKDPEENETAQLVPNARLLRAFDSIACRYCQTNDSLFRLISPCICKGTMAYVHRSCLERWLTISGKLNCELCQFHFQTRQTLRYSWLQSIRLWYNYPENRDFLHSDVLVCSLLTIVCFGLIAISMLGLEYILLQGNRAGFSQLWTQGFIIIFIVIILFAYCLNLYFILKSQLVPWYRWWQSARIVQLVLMDQNDKSLKIDS